MLNTSLTHPDILAALSRAGHGSMVLIADGNYPAATASGRYATMVPLNVRPGLVAATDLLEAVAAVQPVEAAYVMEPDRDGTGAEDGDPEIWGDYARILAASGSPVDLEGIARHAFYDRCRQDDVTLVVHTGEPRLYANLLLQLGVVAPASP